MKHHWFKAFQLLYFVTTPSVIQHVFGPRLPILLAKAKTLGSVEMACFGPCFPT